MLKKICFSIVLLVGFIQPANAVEFDYEFKECAEVQSNKKVLSTMQAMHGKMTEVIRGKDVVLFNKAGAEMMNREYKPEDYIPMDAIFVFKSYPNVGLMVAFHEGCYTAHKIAPLDMVNKHLEIFYRIRDKGDL